MAHIWCEVNGDALIADGIKRAVQSSIFGYFHNFHGRWIFLLWAAIVTLGCLLSLFLSVRILGTGEGSVINTYSVKWLACLLPWSFKLIRPGTSEEVDGTSAEYSPSIQRSSPATFSQLTHFKIAGSDRQARVKKLRENGWSTPGRSSRASTDSIQSNIKR